MKGFFISRKSAGQFDTLSLPSGPNLAVAKADDRLSLTIRVYNYSLVNTDTTTPVHVRFYGQLIAAPTVPAKRVAQTGRPTRRAMVVIYAVVGFMR